MGVSFDPGRFYGVKMVPVVVFVGSVGSVGTVCGVPAVVDGGGSVPWRLSMMGDWLTLPSGERNSAEAGWDVHTEQVGDDNRAHADAILVPAVVVTDGRNWTRPKRTNPTNS